MEYIKGEALITAIDDMNTNLAMHIIRSNIDNPEFNVNYVNRQGETALMKASMTGNITLVISLIDRGAQLDNKDKYGNTALIEAMKNRYIYIVNYLIDKNADVRCINDNGNSVVTYAAMFGDSELILRLIDKNVDIYQQNKDNDTIFDYARICQNYKTIPILHYYKNAYNYGWAPKTAFAFYNHKYIVNILFSLWCVSY